MTDPLAGVTHYEIVGHGINQQNLTRLYSYAHQSGYFQREERNMQTEHFDTYAVAKAFNEWMRRYTEDPSQFDHEWQTVTSFLKQTDEGVEPDYGKSCAAYLVKLLDEAS